MNRPNIPANCADDFDPDSLAIEKARALILDCVNTLSESESVPLSHCFGRVLATELHSPIDVPSFRNSAMDGYAFRYQDAASGDSLMLAGTSLAGHPYHLEIDSGHCIKIMTGAHVPDALDTIVMQEHVDVDNNLVSIEKLPAQGSNVRMPGSNIEKDALLLQQFSRIGAVESGLLASIGKSEVNVLRKLRVACFSTGDELLDVGMALDTGMIFDSNRAMLLNLLHNPAIEVIDLGICPDSESALREVIEQSASADVVISSGGVSVGDADFIRQILDDAGQINLWKIAMKPGRPLTYAILHSGAHYFGLPGNPVSGIVTYHQFVQPAIERLLGQAPRLPVEIVARMDSKISKQPGRVELQRGVLWQDQHAQWRVNSTGAQDSHVLTSMQRANCYIVLDLDSTGADVDEEVVALPFSNFGQQF